MLRNVLEDYLSSVKEREFYYPLTALLHAMGFYDIHLTDGGSEIGKDFVAKRVEEGITYQYVIQAKRGDINQSDFRQIQQQLLEAIILKNLTHSQLDLSLPQRTILVTTGELKDNAILELREFNSTLVNRYKTEKVEFWGKNTLIEFSEKYGLTGVHRTTASGLRGFAQFYLTYSKAIQGNLSDREIEEFSRLWLDGTLEYKKRILRASIEADIIATKLIESGHIYEAVTVYLSLARLVMQVMYEHANKDVNEILEEIVNDKVLTLCRQFFNEFRSEWEQAERSLLNLCFNHSYMPMLHYLVWCARVLEIASLYFFLTKDEAEREEVATFLTEFLEMEEGCGHVPSDRYATSLVWAALALMKARRADRARTLVKRSVVWLCDRVEKGFGIARYDADEKEETYVLLGYAFDFIKVDQNRSSYLATIVSDLAAFIGDKELYADVVNDLAACEVVYSYWQFPDTEAILTIDTEECRMYPNIPHQFSITVFEDFEYAEHIKHEPSYFQIVEKAGLNSLILLSVLLKDRYFPKMWKQIISGTEEQVTVAAA
jgi:Restriction endonuclease